MKPEGAAFVQHLNLESTAVLSMRMPQDRLTRLSVRSEVYFLLNFSKSIPVVGGFDDYFTKTAGEPQGTLLANVCSFSVALDLRNCSHILDL